MFFLNPLYLWALLGLAIPLAIHLWSKKEGKTIKIGSIKLLNDEDSRQSSSISFNELLLLLLRSLLIITLVLILAEPQIEREKKNSSITYIIEPSLLGNTAMSSLIDGLAEDSEIRLLQNGFPMLADEALKSDTNPIPNYWRLANDMEALHTDSIVVFTKALTSGIKGKRPTLSKNIEWILLDPGQSVEQLIEATQIKDQIELISVQSNSKYLSYNKQTISKNNSIVQLNDSKDSIVMNVNDQLQILPLATALALKILIYYEPEYEADSNFIEASFNAISQHLNRQFELVKTQEEPKEVLSGYDRIVWLSKKSIDSSSGRTLKYRADSLSTELIVEGATYDEFFLTRHLNSENIFEDRLTEELLSWLDVRPGLNEKVKPLDKRTVNISELRPQYIKTESDRKYMGTVSMTKWLWVLLVVLLLLERVVAKLRKQ